MLCPQHLGTGRMNNVLGTGRMSALGSTAFHLPNGQRRHLGTGQMLGIGHRLKAHLWTANF